MTNNINKPADTVQGQSEEVEQFALFMFQGGLGKNIKSRIKSHGCLWNPLFQGWICPLSRQQQVQNIIQETKLGYKSRIISAPKGMISTDPRIAGRQSRLEILEMEAHREDKQLLEDVYRYNPSLRPDDFFELQDEVGKSSVQIQIEKEFHARWIVLKKLKEEIEQAKNELSHLCTDPGEKVLNHDAPLLIADSLIQKHFLYKEHSTLQYCSDSFFRWNGIRYVEIEEGEIRQIIYSFLRDAKELNDAGHLECFNPTKHKVDQIIDALRAICYQKHHPSSGAVWLDGRDAPDPQYLISFSNGLLSIIDWLQDSSTLLIPHTPLLLNVNSLTFNFDPHAPMPIAWVQFLNTIWPEDVESQQILQEWIGYLLTQDTRQQNSSDSRPS